MDSWIHGLSGRMGPGWMHCLESALAPSGFEFFAAWNGEHGDGEFAAGPGRAATALPDGVAELMMKLCHFAGGQLWAEENHQHADVEVIRDGRWDAHCAVQSTRTDVRGAIMIRVLIRSRESTSACLSIQVWTAAMEAEEDARPRPSLRSIPTSTSRLVSGRMITWGRVLNGSDM